MVNEEQNITWSVSRRSIFHFNYQNGSHYIIITGYKVMLCILWRPHNSYWKLIYYQGRSTYSHVHLNNIIWTVVYCFILKWLWPLICWTDYVAFESWHKRVIWDSTWSHDILYLLASRSVFILPSVRYLTLFVQFPITNIISHVLFQMESEIHKISTRRSKSFEHSRFTELSLKPNEGVWGILR